MTTTIRTIGGSSHRDHPALARSRPSSLYAPVIHAVAGERVACTVLARDDPTGAAEHRIGLAAGLPFTALVLLQERRGFLAALSGIYGTDFSRGFGQVACLRRIDVTRAFVEDAQYRRMILNQVCRSTLGTSGFLAVHPGRGIWKSSASVTLRPGGSETLSLCHLFGTSGFAQLCDDQVLERPVPLFLAPWRRDQGLLEPRRLPREAFSRTMRVHRLRAGRMILFDEDASQP